MNSTILFLTLGLKSPFHVEPQPPLGLVVVAALLLQSVSLVSAVVMSPN